MYFALNMLHIAAEYAALNMLHILHTKFCSLFSVDTFMTIFKDLNISGVLIVKIIGQFILLYLMD